MFHDVPPEGEVRCTIPRCPLPAGPLLAHLWAERGAASDWIQRASDLTVAEGDFFGSGRRLPDSHQTVLVDHAWVGGGRGRAGCAR